MWAADLAAPEYQVKAAFLLNLAKFTDWPPPSPGESAGSFVIGVLGEDPFRNALEDVLKGQTLKGRKLVLRRLQAVDDASACHLLFISRSEKDRLPALLIALEKKSVLTISDFEGFCQRGGMINLMVSGDGTIKPEINPEAARAAGLQFSSKLLKLPTIRIASTVTAP